jgi:hypothetical protein
VTSREPAQPRSEHQAEGVEVRAETLDEDLAQTRDGGAVGAHPDPVSWRIVMPDVL